MLQKQKETILSLERAKYASKDFAINYLLYYMDFLDTTDAFTHFNCEGLEGKEDYISLIKQVLAVDETAKVFVEVYGFEEDDDDTWIYAETLIVFSRLSFSAIKQIFNKAKDIFPSDIGEILDFDEKNIIIDKDGNQSFAMNLCNENYHVYFCWWD